MTFFQMNTLETLRSEMETIVMVDVETAGPAPSLYSLLSIGACTILGPRKTFYVELKPDKLAADPEALAVSHFTLEELLAVGTEPASAMAQFEGWLNVELPGVKPIFAAFNAPFDWMFIHDYFIRYLGDNPFGHSAIDIKAVYLGATGKSWQETSGVYLHSRYHDGSKRSHNALEDAVAQGEIFEGILREMQSNIQDIAAYPSTHPSE